MTIYIARLGSDPLSNGRFHRNPLLSPYSHNRSSPHHSSNHFPRAGLFGRPSLARHRRARGATDLPRGFSTQPENPLRPPVAISLMLASAGRRPTPPEVKYPLPVDEAAGKHRRSRQSELEDAPFLESIPAYRYSAP